MKMLLCKKYAGGLAASLLFGLGLLILPSSGNALVLDLDVYNDNGTPTDFAAEVDISCGVSGCTFIFTNTSPVPGTAEDSAIHQIYFEEGFATYFDDSSITSEVGVDFEKGTVNSGTKPQAANLIDWTATWSEGFFDRVGNVDNGIQPGGDSLTIFLAFESGGFTTMFIVNQILDELADMMVAIHVNDCAEGISCNANAVPIPGAIWLLGSALLGLFGFNARGRLFRRG